MLNEGSKVFKAQISPSKCSGMLTKVDLSHLPPTFDVAAAIDSAFLKF